MVQFSKLNYINVGPRGTFKPSGDLHTPPADIDAIFDHLHQQGVTKLVVHFHGGLVGERKGKEVAEKMWNVFKGDAHPVTFVWETGFVETIKANLTSVHGTKLFKKAVRYALRHAAKHLGGDIGGKGPGQAMSLEEIARELETDTMFDQFDAGARGGAAQLDEADLDDIRDEVEAEIEEDLDADEEIEGILADEVPATALIDPTFADEIAEDEARGILSIVTLARKLAQVVYRVLKRYVKRRDHGFYPTVVEEVARVLYIADGGAWLWGGMKEAAEAMWRPNHGPLGDDSYPGTYFLHKLAVLQAARPELKVDLTGHSAGSIAICQMLKSSARMAQPLKIRNVVFLAPACRSELFLTEIVQHPGRYQRFRMFTMHDDLETKDRLVPGIYTRSLLYLISGILEDDMAAAPLAGLELQSRGVKPYDSDELLAVHDFIRVAAVDRLVLSETTTGAPGLNSASHSHSDFDDDALTRESLRAIVSS